MVRGKRQRVVQAEGSAGTKGRVCARMTSRGSMRGRPHGEREGPDQGGGRAWICGLCPMGHLKGFKQTGMKQMNDRGAGLEASMSERRLPGHPAKS